MEFAARPAVVAAAALAVGGLIVAGPAMRSLPGTQAPDVSLTTSAESILASLQEAQVGANDKLVDGITDANGGLVGLQEKLIDGVAGGFPADEQHTATLALQHLFEGNNMLFGAGQASLLGALGADFDPATLNQSLLVDADQDSLAAQFGGLEGAAGHNLLLAAGLVHLLSGGGEVPPVGDLVRDMNAFNDGIIDAEQHFNSTLLASEVAMEKAIFGDDSALNGVVNRGFNAFNMLFATQEQSFNGLLGLTDYDPQELTSSLLTGSDAQVFNDGAVGGLQGLFDQNLAMWADVAGLQPGDLVDLSKTFDADAFGDASKAFFEALAGGPFGDAFDGLSPVFDDLGDIFAGLL